MLRFSHFRKRSENPWTNFTLIYDYLTITLLGLLLIRLM
ncbi:hypothetical protein [Pseudomonas sp. 24 E 1]|nr:hypothetical protein [Pseudomonas sp. 24 E 1]